MGRSRRTSLLVSLAVAALLVLVVWRVAVNRGGHGDAAWAGALAAESADSAATVELPVATHMAPVNVEGTDGSEREAVASTLSTQRASLTVRVVDAKGEPVRGARAWIEDEHASATEVAQYAQRYDSDVHELEAGLGREVSLDANACARLEGPLTALRVAARARGLAGCTVVARGDRECVVKLAPSHDVEVLVLGPGDRPVAGAFVATRVRRVGSRSAALSSEFEVEVDGMDRRAAEQLAGTLAARLPPGARIEVSTPEARFNLNGQPVGGEAGVRRIRILPKEQVPVADTAPTPQPEVVDLPAESPELEQALGPPAQTARTDAHGRALLRDVEGQCDFGEYSQVWLDVLFVSSEPARVQLTAEVLEQDKLVVFRVREYGSLRVEPVPSADGSDSVATRIELLAYSSWQGRGVSAPIADVENGAAVFHCVGVGEKLIVRRGDSPSSRTRRAPSPTAHGEVARFRADFTPPRVTSTPPKLESDH